LNYHICQISQTSNFDADEQFMRVIVALLLISIVAGLAGIEAIAADRPAKVALIIGNAKYPDNDAILNDAANDAQDMADEFKSDGFDVEKDINLTGDGMRRALDRHPDGETYNNRCWTRAVLGDLQGAIKDCDEALRLKPGLAVALDSRGLVDLKLGRNTDAIQDYSASIDKDPRSVSSLFGRGLAIRRNGGDGASDLKLAKSMDANIGREFAGYGVNACDR
jgi:tetratricopeptide (TPR) repeat protein